MILLQEVLPGIYKIQVPLPKNPLRALNSYLIKGKERNLLIDTGFNWPECKAAQLKAMEELEVDWADIDFFITHAHGDHVGLVAELADEKSAVYCSRTDAEIIKRFMGPDYWNASNQFYKMHGYPHAVLSRQEDNIEDYITKAARIKPVFVEDGDMLEVGEYRFTCISTPGHSPGHMCLYEGDKKFFFSGDHILESITSNITSWGGGLDTLGMYLDSLVKVDQLEIRLILPGHRNLIRDSHRRIAELIRHHENRLEELLNILAAGPQNAYQAASLMHWDIPCNSWEEFPDYQKWFATGEAIAHLEHLTALGKVRRIQQDEELLYQLA